MSINLEEYLSSRMSEMSNFYTKLNIKVELPLRTNQSQSTYEDFQEKQYKSVAQLNSSHSHNEFVEMGSQEKQMNEVQHSQLTHTFDDVPIKTVTKTFDELLEEQAMGEKEEKQNKKQFLKKGTRQFLSNAQVRSEIQKKEHEEMLRMNNENDQQNMIVNKKKVTYLQKGQGKKCMSRTNESLNSSKFEEQVMEIKHQQQEGEEKLKRIKSQLEQQVKDLQRQKEEQHKQIQHEKQEFERWKEEERKKIDRMRSKQLVNIPQQRQQQLTKKQLEELDYLRRIVKQMQEEIKQLKQNNITINNSSTKQYRSNSYAAMHSNRIDEDDIEELDEEDEDEDIEQQQEQLDITNIYPQHQLSISMINEQIDESQFEYQNNRYYKNYINLTNSKLISSNIAQDGKTHKVYQNGKKEVIFHNGVKREVFPDGYVIVHFTNNDIKQTFPDGTIVYYFSEAKTTQITFHNGPNIYRFINKQIEMHFKDNSKQIRFADGTQKFIFPNGEEETLFSDGIFQRTDSEKVKYIEYPNGSVEIIHPDGRKERQSASNSGSKHSQQ